MHHTSSPCQPPLPENLSPLQQQQLNELFKEYQDVFSQGDEDLGNTPLLEHGIETHGPPSPPTLPAAESRSQEGRNGTSSANAVQQCHSTLQQPMGLSSSNGEEEGRQPAVLC